MPLPDWWDRVDRIMREHGVPTRVWTSISYPESSFIPWSHRYSLATSDDSWGLFQLNRMGGQGRGYSGAYLSDPINNAMIAAPRIGAAVQRCGENDIACIAAWSGHPTENGRATPANELVQNISRYWMLASGKSPAEIYDAFTSGKPPPAAPGGEGSGSQPGAGPSWLQTIVGLLTGGITATVAGSAGAAVARGESGADVAVDTFAGPAFAIIGAWCIFVGVAAAVFRSPPAKLITSVASAIPGPQQAPATITRSAQQVVTPPTPPVKPVNTYPMRPYRRTQQAVPKRSRVTP